MPCVDMPLEKLKTYEGRNPRPADFDEFWDKSLAELDAIDPNPTFTPAEFTCSFAELYELRFTSTKGARIYAKYLRPKNVTSPRPAVVHFHGLSGSFGEWMQLLPWVAEGYVVAAMDCRGQGGHSEDVGGAPGTTYTTPFMRGFDGAPEDLYCRDLFLDTVQLTRLVMKDPAVDPARVGVTGNSQGGALTVACAALVPEVKLCAPVYPYLSDYKRVWEMDLDHGAYEGLKYYFRHFDPAHEREDEIFTKLGYIDIQYLAPRIRAKVEMYTGLRDTTCPPSTQFAAFNKIPSEKNVVIFPDYGHEGIKTLSDRIFHFMKQL